MKKAQNLEIDKKNLIVNRDEYEKQRSNFIKDVAKRRVFSNFEKELQTKINTSEKYVRPEEVANLSKELFLSIIQSINLKKHIEDELKSNKEVKEKLEKITDNQRKKQEEIIEKTREKRFEIAFLQTKLELLERVERKEIITKSIIEDKAFQMLKKEFPHENVMEVASKYSNLNENYLDHLERKVNQYDEWRKEGSLQEVKENGKEELLRLTNPKEYKLYLEEKKNQEQEQNRTKNRGFYSR